MAGLLNWLLGQAEEEEENPKKKGANIPESQNSNVGSRPRPPKLGNVKKSSVAPDAPDLENPSSPNTPTSTTSNNKQARGRERRKSSFLISQSRKSESMGTKIKWLPSFKPLFKESGKLAFNFELKQFPLVNLQIIPVLLFIFFLYIANPFDMDLPVVILHTIANGTMTNTTHILSTVINSTTLQPLPEFSFLNAISNSTTFISHDAIPVADPVMYTTIVGTGLLFSMMGCSFSACISLISNISYRHIVPIFVIIVSTYGVSIYQISKKLGAGTTT